MRSVSAEVARSLRAIPDCFSQLMYLGSLRDQRGVYQHWGLTREYGEERTGAAYQEAHQITYEGVLQTDLSELLASLSEHCERSRQSCDDVMSKLQWATRITPVGIQEHTSMHFNYVLASLLALYQSSC